MSDRLAEMRARFEGGGPVEYDDVEWLMERIGELREALSWLVHLHHGISKGGNIEIMEEEVPYRVPYPVTDEEWRDALTEAERVLEGKTVREAGE